MLNGKIAFVIGVDWVPEISLYLITKSYPTLNLVAWFFIPPMEGIKWKAYLCR